MPGPYKPLTPDQMVAAKAFAPFELAEVMALWVRRANDDFQRAGMAYPEICTAAAIEATPLGPPWPCGIESPEQFGVRVATAIVHLIKEV